MDMNKSIVCISNHFWNDFWFRKQHFMSRFAKEGYKILYVQPTHSMVRLYRKPELSDNRFFLPLRKRLNDNITLLSPPRMLPKPNEPLSSIVSNYYICWHIGRTVKRLGMSGGILWIYPPECVCGIDLIPHRTLVFDLADNYAAYNESANRYSDYMAKCTDILAGQADLMIVTSPTLKYMYKNRTKSCELIPNGFDEKLFDGKPKSVPHDMSKISKPIAGFVGTLFSFLDYQLVYDTAKSLPKVSFVFVGPVEQSGKIGVDLLNSLDNTHFLGSKKKEAVPEYVSNFDICINPFKVDNVSKAVSPLKVYEYLATGRPVLSTPMAGLKKEKVGKWVHFAEPSRFAEALSGMLNSGKIHKLNTNQIAAVNQFSWSSHFKKLSKLVRDLP